MKARDIAVATFLALAACNAVFPVVKDLSTIVLDDIEAGDGQAQIASDVCKALGGTSTTDAVCADVSTLIVNIITDLLAKGKLSAVGETRARVMLSSFKAPHP